MIIARLRKRPVRSAGALAILAFLIWYLCALPDPLFQTDTSMVLEATDGRLLGARIADDAQWRFPEIDSVPEKFRHAIIEFEDRRFAHHWGVDIRALGRAFLQNIRARRIVSGGSTLSMQVMRLARSPNRRSLWQKGIETILATRLEFRYSKDEILALYASHAPFGGNVVGLEAASWRYFGKSPDLLSWAEAATLAVLPNSPGLIHPGRNRESLLAKRNRLLDRLLAAGHLDTLDCTLAREEPLPGPPLPLPRHAPHLLHRAEAELADRGSSRFRSSVDYRLQLRVNQIAREQWERLRSNDINNLAVLVADIRTGEVLAYTGNAPGTGGAHQEWVDIITAPRSTGSILKPLLFARMLETGSISPVSLVTDIPTSINGYRPENFHLDYEGALPAREALARSLNVPFVRMLRQYGLERFHYDLQRLGISKLRENPDHYGLTLILGGAEASLWDLCGIYAAMARSLYRFHQRSGEYDPNEYRPLSLQPVPEASAVSLAAQPPILSAAAIWQTFSAMEALERPGSEGEWKRFSSSRRIAWKTGTSFGFRDAWAIGVDARYLVGVWVGNADGEGRPGLVGVRAAAPILFQVFDQLPPVSWFEPPLDELRPLVVCRQSGLPATRYCSPDTIRSLQAGQQLPPCTYHQLVHLDPARNLRLNSSCAEPGEWEDQTWFVLPPAREYYYRRNHPEYRLLPPYAPGCTPDETNQPMQLIYPEQRARIFIPVNLDGSRSATVFRAAHRQDRAEVHWHLNNQYVGTTRIFHELSLDPEPGVHRLTLVDNHGNRVEQTFEIIEKPQQ